MQGQVSALHQALMNIVSAGNYSKQSWISQCLAVAILHQHSHFATDALQTWFHLQRQKIF
jgi:hypothetical protein